jgi:predicted secreted hydrolase
LPYNCEKENNRGIMANGWKWALIAALILVVLILGLSLVDVGGVDEVGATSQLQASDIDYEAYARAIEPYNWSFPADFGAHPEFLTEWWYYTGNLATAEGRRFGFQFTVFRRAISPVSSDSESEWRSNQIYLVHFTLSDIEGNQFYHEQRVSRGSAGLAGAEVFPLYHVWVDDWQILAQDDIAHLVTIQASAEDFAIDLVLEQLVAPVLQGDNGLSQKGEEPGNASYYYSLPRLATSGTISVNDESFTVEGFSWKDHEFSTSALGEGAQGWDWFGLIFDNDTELMIGQIRMSDGSREPAFGGLLINEDGSTEYLSAENFTISPTGTWQSPHTGAVYPSGWDITINSSQGSFSIHLEPLMQDQELADTDPAYWEGAVQITGERTGYGYAELTGYVSSMENRF